MSAKICVIVGFGPGVSLGVAKAFAQEGYTLALIARNPGKLTETAQALAGFSHHIFVGDAGNEASLLQAFRQIREQLGDPEVLIYNAAVLTPGRPSTLGAEQVVADFRVNVLGALVCAQQVLPAMRAQSKGTILFTGGGFALYPFMDAASLSIGKAGIRSLAYTLAQEMEGTGIHGATVTIGGTVEPGTHFDPDLIAQSYLTLHRQSPGAFDTEVMYR